ncbi:DnaB-like helicase C-terminal domain-containing protein [Fusobacterium nucleatum]|nr:DnaB-like helicase C-terminal domain-containing protein [Fusobacterium nucleatum]WDF24592.1 DnaB-like helicase C-terminal domain-containing protein [Fusobacterium nucleatum]
MKIDTICYEEKALISMLYLANDVACKNKIKNIPTKYFSSLVQSFIKKYKTYEMKNLSVDSLLEEKEYKSFLAEAFELPVVVLEENIDKYTKMLENRYYKNCIIELANTPNELIKEKINELHSEVVKENDKSIKVADIKDLESLFYESLEENEAVKTGKFRLDKYLKFTKRDLHIIGARPGVGKSAFALYIALMMAQFSRGLFFSLEMPLKQIAQRIISNQTRIELDKLTNKEKFKELTADEKELVNVLFRKLLRKSSLILYDGNFRIDELEEYIKNEKEINGLDYIVVDYLQLVKSSKSSRYEQITEISIRLKQIAKDYDIAVIALSQLSRDIEKRVDKDIYLADFRESGQIEQDASTILGLTTEPTTTEYKELMKVQILKNRQGQLGVMKYEYYKKNQTFFEV